MVQQKPFGGGAEHPEPFVQVTRRSWLTRVFLGMTGVSAALPRAWPMQASGSASEAEEISLVKAIAKKAGLQPFSNSRTEHFLGLGDADDRFRNSALSICESLAPAFIQHFNDKGFKLALPKNRLTVITLDSAESYKAFIGEDPGAMVGGHYDIDTNRLVMFDFRPVGQGPGVVNNPKRVNYLALVHETTHLLCYNTGLLLRQADVPVWVSEGLATYVELWQKKGTKIGEPNVPWISYLRATKKTNWVPIKDLVAGDKSFDNDKTAQLSQAESWLMVHYLMKPPQLAKFQSYLAGIGADKAASNRVKYAESHLGSLDDLEHNLERYFKRVSR